MKKSLFFTLALSALCSQSYGMEEEKIVYRQGVGYSDAHSFKMHLFNGPEDTSVTITSTDPTLKIVNVAGRSIPSMKTMPIDNTAPNKLMLVPDMDEKDNLVGKPYVFPKFGPGLFESVKRDGSSYTHSTSPFVFFFSKDETDAQYSVNSAYLKVKVQYQDKMSYQWFGFNSILPDHLIIKHEGDGFSIRFSNRVFPRQNNNLSIDLFSKDPFKK